MDIDTDSRHSLINNEAITETGELLGWVRGFKSNDETGEVYSLIVASLGLPQIPVQLLSTYELPVEEIFSSGPNRLIVLGGAEQRLVQLSVGILERLGLGRPAWKRTKKGIVTHSYKWEDEDDDTGSSASIPIPRRPGPRPKTNDSAELPPIEPEPTPSQRPSFVSPTEAKLITEVWTGESGERVDT